ncbi:hypothetical protein, partial [Chitinimonas sp.]|uniref:hypothetical protein n=1 Tax=Chitinimonas sp. TaxID=1934313 RepID=UPI0035B14E81
PRVIAVSTYGTGNAEVLAVPAPDHSQLKLGKWSFEANKLAVKKGCIGDGAWLITPPAPREAYRVFCDNGRAFTAMCDSFQCLEDK